jgi:hypothetical protein
VIGSDGIVYVGLGVGVYAFSATASGTATPLWSYQTQNEIISSPAIGTVGSKAVLYLSHRGISGCTPFPAHRPDRPLRISVHREISLRRLGSRSVRLKPWWWATPYSSTPRNSTDPEHDALTFAWDFGDGSPPAVGTIASHTYLTPARSRDTR